MPSVLIAECIHEICSFNRVPTRYDDFAIQRGHALFDYHRRMGTEVGGAPNVLEAEPGLELCPTFGARGITWGDHLGGRLRPAGRRIPRRAPPGRAGQWGLLRLARRDGLHDDPEGYLLQEACKILGEDIPIVASFDLHGILTDRMLTHADAVVVYHTYPHVDFFETGQRSARLLLRLLRKEIRPVTARVAIPALVRGDELITGTGVFGQIVGRARHIEQSPGGISARAGEMG